MVRRPIHRIDGDMVKPEFDELAEEVIVSIYNNDEVVVRLLATPEDLEDLAVGHIACEGKGEIEEISVNNHEITINGSIKMRPRDDILTAACGVCTSGEIEIPLSIVDNTQRLSATIQDMMNLMRQAVRIIEHLGSGNHKDIHNKRALEITEAKIRRLANYYKTEGKLSSDWRYKRDELRLMVE